MPFDLHAWLLDNLNGLNTRREKPLSKAELARRSGVKLRTIYRIYAGAAASEETWQRLLEAAMTP